MNPLTLSLISFACIFAGVLLGMVLRTLLPEHHMSTETRDAVKLGTGIIATLTALVLGLLIASAKGTFDTMTNEIRQTGARIVMLDQVMAQYGTDTRDARDILIRSLTSTIQRIWPAEIHTVTSANAYQPGNEFAILQDKLRQLSPHNNAQRWLQSRALQISADIMEVRWLLFEQVGQTTIPEPFLVVLVCWLIMIFTSFGLLSPRNGTVIFVMFVCALSVSAALYLILELDRPYQGLMRVSSAPLNNALVLLGK